MELIRIQTLLKGEILSLIRGSAFIFMLRGLGAAITFATHALLARSMGASELGVYVFAFSVATILAILAGVGLPSAAIRFVPQCVAKGRPDLAGGFVRRSRQIVVGASLVLGSAGLAFALYLKRDYPLSENLALFLGFACIPFLAMLILHQSIARAFLLINTAFLPTFLFRQVLLFLAISCLFFSGFALSASVVVVSLLIVVATLAIGQSLVLQRQIRDQLGVAEPTYATGTWLRTALPLLFIVGLGQYTVEANLLVAGLFLPTDQLAIYSIAFRTAELIGFFLIALGYQFAPDASRYYAQDDFAAFQRLVARVTQLRFWAAATAVIALTFVGKPVLGLIGEEFVRGYHALMIFAVVKLIHGAFGPLTEIVTITGHQNRCLLVLPTAIVIGVSLSALLIPRLGIEGGAIAVLVANLISNAWMYAVVVKRVGIEPSILSLRAAFARTS